MIFVWKSISAETVLLQLTQVNADSVSLSWQIPESPICPIYAQVAFIQKQGVGIVEGRQLDATATSYALQLDAGYSYSLTVAGQCIGATAFVATPQTPTFTMPSGGKLDSLFGVYSKPS